MLSVVKTNFAQLLLLDFKAGSICVIAGFLEFQAIPKLISARYRIFASGIIKLLAHISRAGTG